MASILDLVGIEAPPEIVGPSLAGVFAEPGYDVAPVFFETPNQSGVVYGNAYFRHDRHAADDETFWTAGNPNTLGFWRPLGREFVTPLDPGVEIGQPASEVELEGLLAAFDEDASRARMELEEQQVPVRVSARILERLRALGYAH